MRNAPPALRFDRYVLVPLAYEPPKELFFRTSRAERTSFVERVFAETAPRRKLLDWVRTWFGVARTRETSDEAHARHWLQQALDARMGQLALYRRRVSPVVGELPAGSTPQAMLSEQKPPKLAWLELEVRYADGEDAVGEAFAAELSATDLRAGKLDRYGYTFIDGIPAGSYLTTFKDPKVSGEPEVDVKWLSIEMIDTEGRPVSGVGLGVTPASGDAREVVTDDNGRAKVWGLPDGSHELSILGFQEDEG